mmetsp:Transcript_23868/g.16857  ORF Transcript_23868/g.16857 Transcript_23868/m.16857 type:complete len:113 (+) Transcript_23868:66-404(+)
MLGQFLPPILCVTKEAQKRYSTPESALRAPVTCILERSAILSLCKMICVSQKICEENLDHLFGLLKSHIDYGIKANIIITLGDLYNRFPNLLNDRTPEMFRLLQDRDKNVRR